MEKNLAIILGCRHYAIFNREEPYTKEEIETLRDDDPRLITSKAVACNQVLYGVVTGKMKDADGNDIANDTISTATVIVSTTGALNDADEDGDLYSNYQIQKGDHKLQNLIIKSKSKFIDFNEDFLFLNLNRPSDYQQAINLTNLVDI